MFPIPAALVSRIGACQVAPRQEKTACTCTAAARPLPELPRRSGCRGCWHARAVARAALLAAVGTLARLDDGGDDDKPALPACSLGTLRTELCMSKAAARRLVEELRRQSGQTCDTLGANP